MRGPRLELAGGLYHVFTRGNKRARVFGHQSDYQEFLRRTGKAVERFAWNMHAYALMPNHLHFLVGLTETNLSRGMQWLLGGYSLFWNRITGQSGHVFQGRFGSRLCQREPYLLELVRYIHMNPVKAKLVAEPVDWVWSSHPVYLGKASCPWLDTEPILQRFGEPECPEERIQELHKFVTRDGTSLVRRRIARLSGGWVLGSESFVEQMKALAKMPFRRTDRQKFPRPQLEQLAAVTATTLGVPQDLILGSGKRPAITKARSVLIWMAVQRYGYMLKEVANYLGRAISVVSRILSKGERMRQQLEPILEQIEDRARMANVKL